MTSEAPRSIRKEQKTKEQYIRFIKTALNRLGFYTPNFNKGITGDTEAEFFNALKNFKRQNGLWVDNEITSGANDKTFKTLNYELENPINYELFKQHYIWRTVGDDKTRSHHAAREGKQFQWRDPPEGGHPGEDFGCRCWAEPIIPMAPKGGDLGFIKATPAALLDPMVDAINPTLSPLDLIGGTGILGKKLISVVGKKIIITYAKKGINKQIIKRGWTKKSIRKVIEKPYKKIETKDIRRSKDGRRKNESATAYLNKDGSYVVRNDRTGDIVQISDKTKLNWKPFFEKGK